MVALVMRYLFVFFSIISISAHAANLTGRIVSITDGDSLTLLDAQHRQHKIRLSGIDAPEKAQPFGQKSKSNLSAMLFNREVVAECGKTDRYRREICKIQVDGVDANLEQIRTGMAWWYRKYATEQTAKDRGGYESAELTAKARGIGLWSDKNPQPPWEFRRK